MTTSDSNPPVHIARAASNEDSLASVFVDWFLFSWTDDAVVALGSTFAWSAYIMNLRSVLHACLPFMPLSHIHHSFARPQTASHIPIGSGALPAL